MLCRHAYAHAQLSMPVWLPPSLSACTAGQVLWPLIMAFLPFTFSCWSSLPKCHTCHKCSNLLNFLLCHPTPLVISPVENTHPLRTAGFTWARVQEGQPDRGRRLSTMSRGRDNAGGVWQELPMLEPRRGSFLCMHTGNHGCSPWNKVKLEEYIPVDS